VIPIASFYPDSGLQIFTEMKVISADNAGTGLVDANTIQKEEKEALQITGEISEVSQQELGDPRNQK